MQFKQLPTCWMHVALNVLLLCHYTAKAKGLVSLTVEGGVSLVGPHCPGTVRLFCEGVNLTTFGWTYNAGNLISDRIVPGDEVTSAFYPRLNNPAFISINISNVSPDDQRLMANFSSVLTVDLLELNNKNVRNITCGEFKDFDTLEVDLGVLSMIRVQWTKLPPACSEYDPSSLMYQISLTGHGLVDVDQEKSCTNSSCSLVFTDFSVNISKYSLMITATNYSHTQKQFELTIAYSSGYYFVWNANSTNCQQYSVQCSATSHNKTDSTLCHVRHTTDHGLSTQFTIPLNTQKHLPYTNPGTVHFFEFSAMVENYLMIMEQFTRHEPSTLEPKALIILTITSLFLPLALLHLIMLLLSAFCKANVLISKKEAHTISAIVLIILVFICVALLFAFGIITNDVCSSNWRTIRDSLLEVMIVVSSLGIAFVIIIWILMVYGLKKHKTVRSCETEYVHNSNVQQKTSSTELAKTAVTSSSFSNPYYYSGFLKTSTRTTEGGCYDNVTVVKPREQRNYDMLEHSNEHHLKNQQENPQDKTYQYARLNKETMLADPSEAGHYMQLRVKEKSKPVPNLADASYSQVGMRKHEPSVPDDVHNTRIGNQRGDYDVIDQSVQISTPSSRLDSCYETIDKDAVEPKKGVIYSQLRPGEKSKPVPNMEDPSYSHVHIEEEQIEATKKPAKWQIKKLHRNN